MKFVILATLSAIAASSSIENSEEVSSQPSGTYGVAAADGFERNELDKPFSFNDTVLGDSPDSCDFSRMTVHDPAHIRAIMAHPQYIRCEAKKAARKARKAAMSERGARHEIRKPERASEDSN
ncbi:hypothetical protein OXX79_001200 [Metschnikowia pulcherrima]